MFNIRYKDPHDECCVYEIDWYQKKRWHRLYNTFYGYM